MTKGQKTQAAKKLIEAVKSNPDACFRVVRLIDVFKIRPVEEAYGIPPGSLAVARKGKTQTGYKHSDKLARMFEDIIIALADELDKENEA